MLQNSAIFLIGYFDISIMSDFYFYHIDYFIKALIILRGYTSHSKTNFRLKTPSLIVILAINRPLGNCF